MTDFKVGDLVRRTAGQGEYAKDVGKTFLVIGVHDNGNIQTDGRVGLSKNNFELVETSPGLEKVETDPNGVPANAPGSKLDAGKPRPALVLGEFARALSTVVDIGTFGARKYTPKGWVSVPDGQERYADAAWRHQLEVWKGNKIDNGKGGTGGLHKAQVIWNLLAELELELRAEEKQ